MRQTTVSTSFGPSRVIKTYRKPKNYRSVQKKRDKFLKNVPSQALVWARFGRHHPT
jgi:hypothetical protein